MVTNHTQWRPPPNNVDTNLNYSQLPMANERTSLGVSTVSNSFGEATYDTFQPPTSVQRQDYPVVSSHPQLNHYWPTNSTLTVGSWSNERDSGQEYWQQQRPPPNNVDTNVNYSQLPMANERTLFGVSTLLHSSSQAASNTFQPSASVQRQDYPASHHPQLEY